MLRVITGIKEVQNVSREYKINGKKIGFVPTMGYLHEGHISLVKKSKETADITIVSVFVNPTQFAPNEDYGKYPRDFEKDKALLASAGADIIFLPTAEEIYPAGYQTYVEVTEITKYLEGEIRPTHFKGVTTVVSILFNSVLPDYAFFGQKDAQQVAVIKRMVNDLKFPVEIVVCPIIREADGLAMSSRNIYLNPQEREKALLLSKSIFQAKAMIEAGEKNSVKIIKEVNRNFITEKSIHLNYLKIVDSGTFNDADILKAGTEYTVLIAAKIGTTRLIDNLTIKA